MVYNFALLTRNRSLGYNFDRKSNFLSFVDHGTLKVHCSTKILTKYDKVTFKLYIHPNWLVLLNLGITL